MTSSSARSNDATRLVRAKVFAYDKLDKVRPRPMLLRGDFVESRKYRFAKPNGYRLGRFADNAFAEIT